MRTATGHEPARTGTDLATRLGRPPGSFPGLDCLSAAQRERLGAAIDAAGSAHEQALRAALPAWLRVLLRLGGK